MGKVFVLDHPLIQHKLTYIRDKRTGTKEFRELVDEVAMLMAFEITRNLPLQDKTIKTPVMEAEAQVLAGKKIGLIPILRAGLGMVDCMLYFLPAALVCHVVLYCYNDTLQPVEYYIKLASDIAERELIVLDPMLATGGSANDAIHSLKMRGAINIELMCLVAAPEGVELVKEDHRDVDIYLGALDEELTEDSYIIPGRGDAGDRLFGTK